MGKDAYPTIHGMPPPIPQVPCRPGPHAADTCLPSTSKLPSWMVGDSALAESERLLLLGWGWDLATPQGAPHWAEYMAVFFLVILKSGCI